MKKFKIQIDPSALSDIQEIKRWYNSRQPMLGLRFQDTAINQINKLDKAPHSHAIRYNEIRCLPIKGFPYMIHFYIDEESNTSIVLAIISTDRNPKIWKNKTGNFQF